MRSSFAFLRADVYRWYSCGAYNGPPTLQRSSAWSSACLTSWGIGGPSHPEKRNEPKTPRRRNGRKAFMGMVIRLLLALSFLRCRYLLHGLLDLVGYACGLLADGLGLVRCGPVICARHQVLYLGEAIFKTLH